MRKLVISPQGGLGNRLRSTCSALLLAEITHRKPFLYWKAMKEGSSGFAHVKAIQETSFSTFFEPRVDEFPDTEEVNMCYTEWLPGDHWYAFQNFAQASLPVRNRKKLATCADEITKDESQVILVETSLPLTLSSYSKEQWQRMLSLTYRKYFVPKRKYLDLVYQLPCLGVGISIRRGEFLWYFPEACQNLEDITAWILDLKKKHDKIILFSDEEVTRTFLQSKTGCPWGFDRRGLTALEQGFVEFLILSLRCAFIYGTPKSSFAQEAALFGSVPYAENLSKEKEPTG
ncbi:Hypothetical protein BRZCDTV_60 [Brazilian cedratvirus IHUMI]|uniref:Uncharacterized protein n=1 Tax=Brazilian cedratvirus IHUMI TaxID=2126980 RepID=A0A2R8FD22_9VIRU|nr:Hypothetical protein BRZCDTV_60 [Brazilian cedratvirus IHUMI]